jgi:hypothetical protein
MPASEVFALTEITFMNSVAFRVKRFNWRLKTQDVERFVQTVSAANDDYASMLWTIRPSTSVSRKFRPL